MAICAFSQQPIASATRLSHPPGVSALFSVFDEDDVIIEWKVCDLEAGRIDLVNLPIPVREAQINRTSRTTAWLSG